jgi:ribonuclease J
MSLGQSEKQHNDKRNRQHRGGGQAKHKKTGTVPSGSLLVDGLGIEDIDSIVLRDRKHLSEDGIIVAVIGINEDNGEITSGPEIIAAAL